MSPTSKYISAFKDKEYINRSGRIFQPKEDAESFANEFNSSPKVNEKYKSPFLGANKEISDNKLTSSDIRNFSNKLRFLSENELRILDQK